MSTLCYINYVRKLKAIKACTYIHTDTVTLVLYTVAKWNGVVEWGVFSMCKTPGLYTMVLVCTVGLV